MEEILLPIKELTLAVLILALVVWLVPVFNVREEIELAVSCAEERIVVESPVSVARPPT
jgi:hypothetical protein